MFGYNFKRIVYESNLEIRKHNYFLFLQASESYNLLVTGLISAMTGAFRMEQRQNSIGKKSFFLIRYSEEECCFASWAE